MSQIFKISFHDGRGNEEMFAIKPLFGRFNDFKEEIFIRMPELKNKSLKFYYEDADGDEIIIFNTNDFAIFQEQNISKVFVEVKKENSSANSAILKTPWPLSNAAQVFTPNFMAAPGILKKLPPSVSADDVSRYLHSGVLCDICDNVIRGYRYKCLECVDFDLCMECERTNHSQHLLLRIANPNDAEICYRAKLGKRFSRHRRSESLCSKPTQDRHHDKKGHHDKKAHHKRNAPCPRPANLTNVVSEILKSVVGPGVDARSGKASGSNENPKATTQKNQTDQNGKKPEASSTATPLNMPLQGPLQPLNRLNLPVPPINNPGNGKLKTHIDTLSDMAQNFAAMMDPFATYINESAANIAKRQTPVAAPENFNKRAQDILKTLTPDTVDSVFEHLKSYIDSPEKVTQAVSIIVKKATDEPHLSAEIAKISKKLSESEKFKDALGKSKFERDFLDDVLYHGCNVKRVRLGRLIGELYNQRMFGGFQMISIIDNLFLSITNANLEAICELLKTTGQKLETRTGDKESDEKNYLNLTPYFEKMQIIASSPQTEHGLFQLDSRVRSMLLNLIELRKNNWVQRSETMNGVHTTEESAKSAEPQPSDQSVAMVIDCSDDDEESAGMLNRVSREGSSDGGQSEKSNRGDSPSREWAFVDANEIDDASAQASALAQASTSAQGGPPLVAKQTGTLPKQLSTNTEFAKPTTGEPSLDYSELSRRLNDHIIGEKIAETVEKKLATALSAVSRSHKTAESQVKPVVLAPKVTPPTTTTTTTTNDAESRPSTDPRIIQAVNTMTAMGFSNEGGWLNQLLEAVNGDITNAIELMQPQK